MFMAGYQITKEKTYAIQFHPEVYHSTDGKQLLSNFLVNMASVIKIGRQTHLYNEQH